MRYTIERFAGLQQQVDEHLLPASATPDAVNMNAEEQDLQVAAGYRTLHDGGAGRRDRDAGGLLPPKRGRGRHAAAGGELDRAV